MTIRYFIHTLEHAALAIAFAGAAAVGAAAAFQTTEPVLAILACTGAAVLALPITVAIAFVGAEVMARSYLRWSRYTRRWEKRLESCRWRVDARLSTLAREEASRC